MITPTYEKSLGWTPQMLAQILRDTLEKVVGENNFSESISEVGEVTVVNSTRGLDVSISKKAQSRGLYVVAFAYKNIDDFVKLAGEYVFSSASAKIQIGFQTMGDLEIRMPLIYETMKTKNIRNFLL